MTQARERSPSLGPEQAGNMVPAVPSLVGSGASSGSRDEQLFHLNVLRSLQLHRRLAVGIFLLGLGLAAAYFAMNWPLYIAQSQMFIQPAPPTVMVEGSTARWPFDASTVESFIQQQVLSAAHEEVLLNTLHKLKPGSWQRADESEMDAAKRLGRSIDVARIGSSFKVMITARSTNAELSAEMANAMAASLLESASREQKAGDEERLAMLRDERERVKNELAADRAEQESLSKKLGVAAVGPTTPDPYDNEIARLRDELVKARTAHDEAAARLISMDATQPVSSAALSAEADELTATDPGLLSIRTPLNQQRAALIAQMADLSPNHPQYKQDAQKLKEIDASLAAMQNDMRSSLSARIRQRLRTDLNRTGDVEGRLNAQLGQLTGAAVNATPKLQRANDLTADIARLQGRFAIVDERFHDLTIENSAPGAAHIWAAATPPLHPSVIGILRIAALIAFAGAILALVAALLANFLDPRVYIGADIEQALGFSPMAQIPDFTEVSDGVAEEHLLRLAAALDHGFQQGTLKKCLFTGTAPGTGVTAVVTRIGAMIEAMGAPTVLVDLSGAGSVPAHAGSAGSDLYDALDTRSTHRGGRSTALLQQLSDVPESEQGLVLIDAAPLPISAETEYLARYVDATIVVVESGVTTRAQVRAAANTLQRLEVAAMGFVLNRIRLEKADPGFRQSISATERHLRTQSRSFPRLTARSRPPAPAPPPPTDQASHADNPGPPVPQAVPARNTFVAEDSVRPHGPVDPALPEALPFQPHVSSVPRGATRIQPVSLTESPASGMEPAGPKQEAPHAPASNPAKPLETLRTSERQDVAPAVSGPHPESRDSQPASTSFPAYVTDWLENVKPRPAQEEVRGPAENTYDAATRLGGLRDLIFPDGPKNEQRAAEAPRQEPVVAHRIDPIHEPPAHAHSSLPAWQTPARKEVLNTAPPRMTAPPEILPPLPLDDAADRELSRGNVTKMRRRDYRDPDDDMGILPASRGQYTRRK